MSQSYRRTVREIISLANDKFVPSFLSVQCTNELCSLLLNKSRYHLNWHGVWLMEHAHTVNRWPDTSTWRKHNLAAAHCLRVTSWYTFKTAAMLVRGRPLWENTRLALSFIYGHHRPARCLGNRVWFNIWTIQFGVFLRRGRPGPVVPNWLVHIR